MNIKGILLIEKSLTRLRKRKSEEKQYYAPVLRSKKGRLK
jgi:hypothetical protein